MCIHKESIAGDYAVKCEKPGLAGTTRSPDVPFVEAISLATTLLEYLVQELSADARVEVINSLKRFIENKPSHQSQGVKNIHMKGDLA